MPHKNRRKLRRFGAGVLQSPAAGQKPWPHGSYLRLSVSSAAIVSIASFMMGSARVTGIGGGGLNLVVWAGVLRPPRPEDHSALCLELMSAFVHEHAGYRLKEFITQLSEHEWTRMTLNMGALLWHAAEGCYRDGRSHSIEEFLRKPFLLGVTRELASEKGEVHGAWASSIFPESRQESIFVPPSCCCCWPL